MYRSPNNSKEDDENINEAFKSMSTANTLTHRLVVGDFNRRKIDWKTMSSSCPNDRKFIEAIEDSYMTQHVNEATRGRGNDTPTLSDLVFSSKAENIEQVKMNPPLGRSDHNIVKILYRHQSETIQDKTISNPKKADFKKMREKLSLDWN